MVLQQRADHVVAVVEQEGHQEGEGRLPGEDKEVGREEEEGEAVEEGVKRMIPPHMPLDKVARER